MPNRAECWITTIITYLNILTVSLSNWQTDSLKNIHRPAKGVESASKKLREVFLTPKNLKNPNFSFFSIFWVKYYTNHVILIEICEFC